MMHTDELAERSGISVSFANQQPVFLAEGASIQFNQINLLLIAALSAGLPCFGISL